jgi:mono/diheme cytochrome c family protein
MKNLLLNRFLPLAVLSVMLVSCGKNPNSPGTEYAPDMYHAISYEPLSQITDTAIGTWRGDRENGRGYFNSQTNATIKGKWYGMNMRYPVKGTVSRRNYQTVFGQGDSATVDLMVYNIPSDSMAMSEKLVNPVPASEKTLKEGEQLYLNYCSHCHGKEGKGNGKVAEQYKGVPVYSSAGLKYLNDGHIFHTITHGKGRMWPHGSQISPVDRWKIVHYVHKLQNQ